jgi:xylulokinase
VTGIGDGQACGLGAGITQPGRAYLSLGTSVISGTFSPTFAAADAFRTMVGGLPGTYLLETVLLGGTYTIDWLLNDFLGHPGLDALEALSAEAALLPPGAEGLVLLPYWNSAMNPHWDAHARGAVIGWRGSHRPAHLLRAILEGIAFELRLQLEAVENALGTAIRELALMGGGSRSRLWCQVIADVCNRPAVTVPEPEAAALGAAMLAAAGVGIHASAEQAAEHMRPALQEPAFQPDAEHAARYDDLYRQVYRPLYPALRGIMGAMARLPSAGPD